MPQVESDTTTLAQDYQYGGLHVSVTDISALGVEILPEGTPITWQIKMTRPGGSNLQTDSVPKSTEVEDFLLVVGYEMGIV